MATTPFAIRIIIAHEHAIVRAGLGTLLQGEHDFTVVGEADSADDTVSIVAERKPDVLLLDAGLTDSAGMAPLDRLRGFPASRIILFGTNLRGSDVMRVLRMGARGVVMKNSPTELLFKSIRTVMNGEYWIGRGEISDLIQLLIQTPVAETELSLPPRTFGLTERERRVVDLVVAGHTNREISQKLTVSQDTVKHHLTSIFDKTGASNRLELALFALYGQLVDGRLLTQSTTR